MVSNKNCFDCDNLFKLSVNNRVEFCNGQNGDFIDAYPDRGSLCRDFKKSARVKKENLHCRRLKSGDSKNYLGQFLNKNELGYLTRFYSRIFCFPTFLCNNSCRHCLAASKSKLRDLNLPQAKGMVRKFSKALAHVHIGGGEPTLFSGLIELIKFSKGLGKKVRLFSNCRKMSDPDFAQSIVGSGLDGIMVPLHSFRAETHDYITQRKGSFKETLEGMDNLKKFGLKDVQVMVVVHKKNYFELERIAKLLSRRKTSSVSLESLVYCGRALSNLDSLKIRVSETVKPIENFFDCLIKAGIPFYTTSLPLCLFKRRYWRYFDNERYSLLATNISEAGNGSSLKFRTAGTSLSGKCIDCKLKLFCPGLWSSYYRVFGDNELAPITNGAASNFIKFVSRTTLEKIFRPV